MSALAQITERDCYTRAANEGLVNGGPRTRTKYGYDSTTGFLASSFFPYGYPTNYRVEVAYSYQNGILSQLSNALNPATIWWQATGANARGQITQENTGDASSFPRIVSNRTYDAVTGWLQTIQTGASGGSAFQNEAYLFDEMGNLTQRQNNNLGLTENFYYDNLNRLYYSTLGGTTNLQMCYDNTGGACTENVAGIGNITSRSDIAGGAAWTYDPAHKHRVTQAGSASYTFSYDANGNVSVRNGSTIGWTSYNYPSAVGTSTESATFDYGPDRQRWRMVYSGPSGTETTYYATPAFEIVATSAGTDYRHYLYANGRPVVVISRTTAGAVNVRSLLTDHQGSISQIITDQLSTPSIYASESFTAYGNRREASTWSGTPTTGELSTMNGVTREGYTFQTVLGSMGLSHMNGRVQDAILGKFLSPDPHIPDKSNTQSYNRYSYVNNNPLSRGDPTGFVDKPDAPGVNNVYNPPDPPTGSLIIGSDIGDASIIYSAGGGASPSQNADGSNSGSNGTGGFFDPKTAADNYLAQNPLPTQSTDLPDEAQGPSFSIGGTLDQLNGDSALRAGSDALACPNCESITVTASAEAASGTMDVFGAGIAVLEAQWGEQFLGPSGRLYSRPWANGTGRTVAIGGLTKLASIYMLAAGTAFDAQSYQDGDISGVQFGANLALGTLGIVFPAAAIGNLNILFIINAYPGGLQGYWEDFYLHPDVLGNPLLGGYDGLR